ncbi:MAG: glucose 1-dehydrogenase [Nitrospirota bacterium]
MKLREKVALVTGGGQGIGKAIVKRFLEEGAGVVVADVDEEAGRETEQELSGIGSLAFVPADVAVEKDVEHAVAQTAARFGRLDILINNAGIFSSAPLERLSLDAWNRIIAVNLTGAFLCAKHAAPLLRERGGAIVNIASTRALMSEPHTEAYAASKGGVVALTHALAVSLGPAIRANCISPGWIEVSGWKRRSARHAASLREADHRQHPAGRVGAPEDIASLTLYLVSEEASFVTGANFVADGGMTRKMLYIE